MTTSSSIQARSFELKRTDIGRGHDITDGSGRNRIVSALPYKGKLPAIPHKNGKEEKENPNKASILPVKNDVKRLDLKELDKPTHTIALQKDDKSGKTSKLQGSTETKNAASGTPGQKDSEVDKVLKDTLNGVNNITGPASIIIDSGLVDKKADEVINLGKDLIKSAPKQGNAAEAEIISADKTLRKAANMVRKIVRDDTIAQGTDMIRAGTALKTAGEVVGKVAMPIGIASDAVALATSDSGFKDNMTSISLAGNTFPLIGNIAGTFVSEAGKKYYDKASEEEKRRLDIYWGITNSSKWKSDLGLDENKVKSPEMSMDRRLPDTTEAQKEAAKSNNKPNNRASDTVSGVNGGLSKIDDSDSNKKLGKNNKSQDKDDDDDKHGSNNKTSGTGGSGGSGLGKPSGTGSGVNGGLSGIGSGSGSGSNNKPGGTGSSAGSGLGKPSGTGSGVNGGLSGIGSGGNSGSNNKPGGGTKPGTNHGHLYD